MCCAAAALAESGGSEWAWRKALDRLAETDTISANMRLWFSIVALAFWAATGLPSGTWASDTTGVPEARTVRSPEVPAASVFEPANLMAWCIVPFDANKRGPEERARMLERLGFRHFAYDWREEHIPTFDAEVEAMQRHGISLDAWWFPAGLDSTARTILQVLERHRVKAQLWVTLGDPAPQSNDAVVKVRAAADIVRPIAKEAARIGCSVGLYNHGGWFGEPENQLAIIEHLGLPNVGIVYNFHHGHDHVQRFDKLFARMQPRLLAVNLNGMVLGGDREGKKILPLGQGDQELGMLRIIRDSGWRGLVGIIDHREETDSEQTLRENLEGLKRLRRQLEP